MCIGKSKGLLVLAVKELLGIWMRHTSLSTLLRLTILRRMLQSEVAKVQGLD